MFVLGLVASCIAFAVSSTVGQLPPPGQCKHGLYPPDNSSNVGTFVIDLDLPPSERWVELARAKKDEVMKIHDVIKSVLDRLLGPRMLKLVDSAMPRLLKSLPSPFREEMVSLSNHSGLPLGEVVLYNVFYEFFTVCTSVVAEDTHGGIYHARNLDFGLFLGWDVRNNTWAMTEALRPTVVNLDFQRLNRTVFKAAGFAGYVGVLTAVKPGAFSLTVNERFKLNGGYIGLLEWVLGDHSEHWVGFLTRHVMENVTDYESARSVLTTTKLIAPAYFILGGNRSGEGVILTKDRNSPTSDTYGLRDTADKWFVLQTNYDHWKAPPIYDDRRTPGIHCMRNMTRENLGFDGLFNVLSTQPNLNKLTAYTALMEVQTGKLETYIQDCRDPCYVI